jgi:hypothetical protein
LRTKRKFRALIFDSFDQAKEWQNKIITQIEIFFEVINVI